MIYEHEERPLPNSDFTEGTLAHLSAGNRGRMLDPRRTPVIITAVSEAEGMFEVELAAFEDVGARWRLPMEDVRNFQFEREAKLVDDAGYAAAVAIFDRTIDIARDRDRLRQTGRAIEARAAEIELALRSGWDGALDVSGRDGSPVLWQAIELVMAERAMEELERQFAITFVSNPNSGELVKGHAIVAAELGLADYHGKVARSKTLFDGEWSRERRAEHLVTRLAFVRAMFSIAGIESVVLYRGLSSERALQERPARTFTSMTFSAEVAEAHFVGGPATVIGLLRRERVAVEHLLMTFLETRAMNSQFREAEAVLIGADSRC